MLVLNPLEFSIGYARTGTLSQAPLSGSASRELLEDVGSADWSPDGANLAVVRAPEWRYRLEYPAGKVLYETTGYISHPRVSPKGDAVALLDHPVLGDDRGTVAIVDLAGKKKTLSGEWESAQGLAWSVSGKEIWFTATRAGSARSVYAVTPAGRERAVLTTPAGLLLQDISRDGRVLLVQSNARVGFFAVLPGETRERDLSGLEWSWGPRLSADGSPSSSRNGRSRPRGLLRLRAQARRVGGGAAGRGNRSGDLTRREVDLDPPHPDDAGHTRASADWRRAAEDLPEGLDRPVPGNGLRGVPSRRQAHRVQRPRGGKPARVFVQGLDGGAARAVTPEGVVARLVSPDGKTLLTDTAGQGFGLVPLDGGGPSVPIRSLEPTDDPLRWAADGRSLFFSNSKDFFPARVYRLDLATGRREVWKEFMPSDPTGLTNIGPSAISADGKTILFGYSHTLSDLYVAEGLR